MTVDKGLMRWECADCGRIGYTTEMVVNAMHPKYSHHKDSDSICIVGGLRGLLFDAEKADKDIVHIVSLRKRIAELS